MLELNQFRFPWAKWSGAEFSGANHPSKVGALRRLNLHYPAHFAHPPLPNVIHDEAASQFTVVAGDDKAILQYELSPGRIAFLHTEVPESFRGQGIAGALAQAGLEYAREQKLGVVPYCPFVRSYIKRHSEYQSLVARW